jgi:hypothetical protein
MFKVEKIDKNHIIIIPQTYLERKYLERTLDWDDTKGKLKEVLCELKGYSLKE